MPRQSQGPRLVTRKGKPNLYIRYIDPATGRQVDCSTGTRDRLEARDILLDFLNEERLARSGSAKPPYRVPIANVLVDHHAQLKAEARSQRFRHSMVHILDHWGDRCLDSVTPNEVKRYIANNVRNDKGEGRSRATIRRELSDFRAAINSAVKEHVVLPVVFPELPPDGAPRTRWLTRAEFDALLAAADIDAIDPHSADQLRLFLLIAYYTGARSTAVMELRWSDIDFDQNVIDFTIKDTGGIIPKKKPRARTLMPPPLRSFLEARAKTYSELPPFVFHQKKNTANRRKSVVQAFRRAVDHLGWTDVTPHTLRHTRVTELRNSGMLPHEVDAYLAMSEEMQSRVYLHVDNDNLQAKVAMIA